MACEIDQAKVFALLERRCSGCGCSHALGGVSTNIDTGAMRCQRCKVHLGNARKAIAARRRGGATRPALVRVHLAPSSTPRPREHRAMPRARWLS